MKYLFFILLISSASAESFKIAGSLLDFSEKEGLLLSGCKGECEALKEIKKHQNINMNEVRKGMTFANSVGSDVCSLVYKADSLLGVAKNTDRRAFCFFKDKSMVEMNSLSQYLVSHKIVE